MCLSKWKSVQLVHLMPMPACAWYPVEVAATERTSVPCTRLSGCSCPLLLQSSSPRTKGSRSVSSSWVNTPSHGRCKSRSGEGGGGERGREKQALSRPTHSPMPQPPPATPWHCPQPQSCVRPPSVQSSQSYVTAPCPPHYSYQPVSAAAPCTLVHIEVSA